MQPFGSLIWLKPAISPSTHCAHCMLHSGAITNVFLHTLFPPSRKCQIFLCPNTSLAKDFKMQMSHWKMLVKRLRIDFYSPRPLTDLPFCVAVPGPASREKYPQYPFQSSPSVGVGDPNYCPGENIPSAPFNFPLLWGPMLGLPSKGR